MTHLHPVRVEPVGPYAESEPQATSQKTSPSRSRMGAVILFAAMVAAPTIAAAIYYGLIAAPVYESEASFLVQGTDRKPQVGLGSVLQSVGLSQGASEPYAVHAYITSRDAVKDLSRVRPLRGVLARPGADFLARFPRPFEGRSDEHLFRAYRRFVTVDYNANTGVSTLQVKAFRAEDAQAVAEALLQGGERVVNQLNVAAERDAIEQAKLEVLEAQGRVASAENALTGFRSRERLIDPSRSSAANLELTGRLSEQLATLRAERAGLAASAPQSPQLPGLDNRIRAYEREIAAEQAKAAGQSNSLAPKIGQYERLTLERDFAGRSMTSALAALETAQQEARRKRLYLQRVVNPSLPDAPMLPRRFRGVLLVLISALLAYGGVVLVLAGLREHRQ